MPSPPNRIRYTAPLAGPLPAALALAAFLAPSPLLPAVAQEPTHETHARHEHQAGDTDARSPLQEPGDAAFAAIREVVEELNRRDDTDWETVDLEALRRHLRDMHRFTLHAEVVEREPIDGGLRVAVRGTTPEADEAVRRALHAHGPVLEEETGWSVDVTDRAERTVLRVTGPSASDAARIRGLGYIGLMATGAHHRRHHWMIATGRSPHRH